MSFYKRFLEWQNYVHYLFLSMWVYIWNSIPYNEIVEQMYLNNAVTGLFVLVLWWAVGLFIGDTIIHGLFWIASKPIRWRD